MEHDIDSTETAKFTPESGFNLVGIDPFGTRGNQLYLIEHFERYKDALDAKKSRKNPDEYMILYPGV